jgi:hypothetical protein
MVDTHIGHLFERIALTFYDINPINTMKILLRVRQMFYAWNLMASILSMIKQRELALRELNETVLDLKLSKEVKASKTRELIDQVTYMSDTILSKIEIFFTRKIFGKVFVFNGLDYVSLIKTEILELNQILQIYSPELLSAI